VIKRIKTAVMSTAALAASASPVLAEIENPIRANTLADLISVVFQAILGIAGALALVLLAIGGIQYMTSGGDKIAVEQARGRITAAVVGLIVVFGAWLVINVVANILGVRNIFSPGF